MVQQLDDIPGDESAFLGGEDDAQEAVVADRSMRYVQTHPHVRTG